MKNTIRRKVRAAALLGLLAILGSAVTGQTVHKSREDAEKNAGQGITFRTPGKFMNAPLSGFKGMLMLNPDAPAAIVVSYPNEDESSDSLVTRLITAVPGFFGDKDQTPEWTSSPIDVNKGDVPGSGILSTGKTRTGRIQLALFRREWKGLTLVYGYFAMRHDNDKENKVKKYWMDEAGRGVKPFEAFWKSFPE